LAGLLILVTALSIVESNEWWIRIWDFPRVQILVALLLAGAAALWLDRRAGRWIALVCAMAAGWQLYRIYPYTPLARTELAFADAGSAAPDHCFSLLSLNVLESNRDYPRTARLIERVRPDILLLMEVASIMTVLGSASADARPSIMRRKTPRSPHRFQRL
jgi:endonuclease/exonuclease/phosphatase (EEP) superfamily protein YafD